MAKREAEAKKKKKRRGRFASPFSSTPIAHKLIAHLRSSGPPDQSLAPEDLEELSDQLAEHTPDNLEKDIDPVGLHYMDCMKLVAFLGNSLGSHPALGKLFDRIEAAEEYYSPEGPPLSPVTHSLFLQWSLLDAQQGIGRETVGSVMEAVQRALNPDSDVLATMATLNRSRLGVYVQERSQKKGRLKLREMVTGHTGEFVCASGYRGEPGNVLLVRALPPPDASADHGAILMTPYVLEGDVEGEWSAFFERTLPTLGIPDRVRAYEQLMKCGTGPSGDRYWLDFVDAAYVDDIGTSIVLGGVPDMESADESEDQDDRLEHALVTTMTGEILQPVRLYWTVSRIASIQSALSELRCIVPDPGVPGIWHWLHQHETLAFQFPNRYDQIPPQVHPINLGMFRLDGETLTLAVRSHDRALHAARFFGAHFGPHATLTRARVLNRFLNGREFQALGLEGVDRLLDDGVVVIDPQASEASLRRSLAGTTTQAEKLAALERHSEDRRKKDVPMVEDFPLAPEEETADFQHLSMTLMFRLLRSREHWKGNTHLTLGDIIHRTLKERMAHRTSKATRGRSVRSARHS